MPILNPQEFAALEALYGIAADRAEPQTLAAARRVLDDLRDGRALERVLDPVIDDLEAEKTELEQAQDGLKKGGPREWAQGKAQGIEHARYRICRENVIRVSG